MKSSKSSIHVLVKYLFLFLLFSDILCFATLSRLNQRDGLELNQTVTRIIAHGQISTSVSRPCRRGEIRNQHGKCVRRRHFRGRHCESLTETFYRGGCHPIGRGKHCPHNSLMVLYDGPNNEGYCDCQDNISGGNGLFPIFSNKTEKCHFQHTQGPCSRGEWFVIKKGAPQCETVPNRCFADGKHVYGHLSNTENDWKSESKCWEIGSTRHCTPKQIVIVQQDLEGDLRLRCSFPFSESTSTFSLAYGPPCRAGTKYDRWNKCSRGFIG